MLSVRTSIALLSSAGLVLALAGCAAGAPGAGQPTGEATTAPSGECAPVAAGAASDAVSVTGAVGEAPTVAFDAPLAVAATERTVVSAGAGDRAAVAGTVVYARYSIFNGATGEPLWEQDYTADPQPIEVDPAVTLTGIVSTLQCAVAGDRVVGVIPAEEAWGPDGQPSVGLGAGEPVVFVVDVDSVEEAVLPLTPKEWVQDVPQVDLTAGIPVVTLPDTAPPADLVLTVLEAGDGAVVGAGDMVELHYQGTSWDTGEIFDQSYTRGSTASFATTQVIEGFGAALVGQKVGTTLIVSIPPRYAYSSGDLAGQTLVFLIEIIGTTPAG